MQNKQQQMVDKMGYDRSITMFSPDGRLLQVEYAKKTVKQGSTAMGIACKDGVVFVVDKRITSKLLVPEAIEKMFVVDDHIGVTLIVGGVEEDGEVKLFLTEPYGLYFQYKAVVIGEGEEEIEAALQKRYKSTLTVDEGLRLGLGLLKEFLKDGFNVDRVDAAYIDAKDKRFVKLSNEELKKLVK